MSGAWVYIRSEPGLWTVGFYTPTGDFSGDSDHDTKESAAERVHYLNGGSPALKPPDEQAFERWLHDCHAAPGAAGPTELWTERCPLCGMPRTVQQLRTDLIAQARGERCQPTDSNQPS